MTITCKNCGTSFKGNFCYNCGQSAHTHRLDLHSVWHDIEHGLLHIDNGIFYTITQLFTRPGHSIREYLEGKRLKHFKPVSLLIILATIYALLNHYFHIDLIQEAENKLTIRNFGMNLQFEATQGEDKPLIGVISDFIESHFALFQLLFLPFYSAASWLAFRKSGYNYIEHLVINAFLRGQAFIIAILLLPFIYFGLTSPETSSNIFTVLQIACLFWTLLQFFTNNKKWWVIKRAFLAMIYLMVETLVIVLIASLVLYIIGLF
jgi:hypothetical protein